MTAPDPFFRILCITRDRPAFDGSVALTWSRSGLVRWDFADHNSPEWRERLPAASLVLLDCSADQVGDASRIQVDIPQDRCWAVDFCGRGRIPWAPDKKPLVSKKLDDALRRLPIPADVPPIQWPDSDPDIRLIRPVLEPILPLVLQKYFPDRKTKAHLHKVVDGWSGTPLIRISIDGQYPEYFLKFFDSYDEFVLEWDNHQRAIDWLGPYAVRLEPVRELALTGVAQAAAFPRDRSAPPESKHFYPVSYYSASVTATLRELYRERDDPFVEGAYREVLSVLKIRQPATQPRHGSLIDLKDLGPGRKRRNPAQTILESLRSSEYQSFIRSAEVELRPYAIRCLGNEPWLQCTEALHGFFDTEATWIAQQLDLSLGYVHGDANARNFLFHRTADKPKDLQFIDCGCCHVEAPLALDLAQMESDLKIVLMATELSAPHYRDIDSGQLEVWAQQEKEALSRLTGFERLQETTDSAWRAYWLVKLIRDRAADASPNDAAGRAYFFHLLYWTLRKLRLTSLPHVKRVLALYSACQICLNMSRWGPP